MNVIPKTIVGSFADGNVLQILLFAVLFGAALSRMGDKGRPFIDWLDMLLGGPPPAAVEAMAGDGVRGDPVVSGD